jgi:hypothetical protein
MSNVHGKIEIAMQPIIKKGRQCFAGQKKRRTHHVVQNNALTIDMSCKLLLHFYLPAPCEYVCFDCSSNPSSFVTVPKHVFWTSSS